MKKQLAIWALMMICHLSTLAQESFAHLSYRNVGPTRGGRVTAVAGHPDLGGTFFMGATGGGVWKTENFGHTWQNVSDGFFATPSIGAITIAPSNSNVVYVGTGSDGIRSNVIIGKGMYRSDDQGKQWTHLGLENAGQIGAVIVHPTDPDIVYTAALGNPFARNEERGVFKSTDGGSTWQKVLYHSDSVGAIDLEFHPSNPEVIYASMWRAERKPWTIISGGHQLGGIYKTVDGGGTWKKLTSGLPTGLIGKSDLAVAPSDPNVVWALVEAPQGEGGVFKSEDAGENFELVSTKKQLLDRPFYYCNIDVNPLNSNSLYVNSTGYWHSVDGGETWKRERTPHGDNHETWISPKDTLLQIQCNDGGANVTRDGGKTWSSILNQSTAELYQVNLDDQTPFWLYAGQQDNSTISVPSEPPYPVAGGSTAYWTAVGGCETGPAVPKPGNPHIVYSNCKGRFGTYNKITGQEQQFYVGAANMYGHNPKDLKFRFQRVSPIHVSPHNPDLVYHTSQFVHKTYDDGRTWEIISPDLTAFDPARQMISGSPITRDITGEEFYSTIYAIQESPVQAGVIWVGANDGPVHVTLDHGRTWQDVTPPSLPPGGRVQTVEASPHHAGTAFISVLRYQLGDFSPHIYKTSDFGANWSKLTSGDNGIPADYPTRVIRQDPINADLLYAGTEFGMFVSHDGGSHWTSLQLDLPVTPISDLKVHHNDLVLSTMGRGFWILDDLQTLRKPLQEFDLSVPGESVMLRYWGSQEVPTYPNPGLVIDYSLDHDYRDQLVMNIRDQQGGIVKSFVLQASEDEPEEESEVSMATGFRSRRSTNALAGKQGPHRLIWDFRHQNPVDSTNQDLAGPRVSPGRFTIELSNGEETLQASTVLVADPRLLEAGIIDADLVEQEQLALQVMTLWQHAQDLQGSLDEDSVEGKIILEELETKEGRYHRPMLIAQIRYLYSMLTRADQRPGLDAHQRADELTAWLAELRSRVESSDD